MNFKSLLQAFSSAIQSNTTTPPPIPATPAQNGPGLPIPEAILMELDLLDQDQDHATSQQSISTMLPLIPAAQMQHDLMPSQDSNQDSDQEFPDLAQAQGWAIARQLISTARPPIPATLI